MHRLLVLLILTAITALTAMPARILGGSAGFNNIPVPGTPQKTVLAWLRFHEMDLCQDVDAVFVFDTKGMESWYVFKDRRSDQKFQGLFSPSDGSYHIELYATQQPDLKKVEDEEAEPPPSLWLNHELRAYLGDSIFIDCDSAQCAGPLAMPAASPVHLARLLLYEEQTLDWSLRAARYAAHLPLLVRTAVAPMAPPEVRLRAVAAINAHAQNLAKNLSKLEASLKHAFPKSAKSKPQPEVHKLPRAVKGHLEEAEQISDSARSVVRRIFNFMHPEHHTVILNELRRPSLLDDLGSLEKTVLEFQKTLPALQSGK